MSQVLQSRPTRSGPSGFATLSSESELALASRNALSPPLFGSLWTGHYKWPLGGILRLPVVFASLQTRRPVGLAPCLENASGLQGSQVLLPILQYQGCHRILAVSDEHPQCPPKGALCPPSPSHQAPVSEPGDGESMRLLKIEEHQSKKHIMHGVDILNMYTYVCM